MWMAYHSRRGRTFLLVLLLIALGVRLWIAWQPIPTLLEKNLPDDAYYYFILAHNTVQSGSVSMDGIHVTNGFHPLWWLFLMPLFGGAPPLTDTHIHLALTLSSLLDVIAVWALAQLGAELTGKESVGLLSGWLYAVNPMVVLQATNGLETALGMATLTVFLLTLLRWLNQPEDLRLTLVVGFLAGLTFLARSDSVFLLGFAFLAALWYWGFKSGVRRLVPAGSLAAVVVAPWLLWSRLAVGTWLQESGVAVPFAVRSRVALESGSGFLVGIGESVRQLTYPSFWLRGDPVGMPLIFAALLWVFVILGLIWGYRVSLPRREIAVIGPLLAAGLALIVAHAGLRWYPRPWYFIPSAATFALASACLLSRSSHQRLGLTLALVVSLYFPFAGNVLWGFGLYPWQREMYAAAGWLSQHVPAGSDVASFNSGIYAYYSGRRVINLDGVVNHEAFEAIKAKDILHYLRESEIDYLIDYDSAVRREYAPFMGPGYPDDLQEIAIVGGEEGGALGLLRFYRVHEPP